MPPRFRGNKITCFIDTNYSTYHKDTSISVLAILLGFTYHINKEAGVHLSCCRAGFYFFNHTSISINIPIPVAIMNSTKQIELGLWVG